MNFCTGNFWHQPVSRRCAWENGKASGKSIFKDDLQIRLYNLEEDIQEQTDVSEHHPVIIQKIEAIFAQQHIPADNERFKMKQLGD